MVYKIFGNITIWGLICIAFIISACNGCNQSKFKHARDTIKAPLYPIKINRFDKELFNADTSNLLPILYDLSKKYGVFYSSYANDIMRMPYNPEDTLFVKPMRMLLGIERLQELHQIVDSNFNDVSDMEYDLSVAMGIYHQEFPEAVVPSFTTFISEFGNGNIIYDSMLCIGLDFYMNQRFGDFYRSLEMPEFMVAKMQKNYIVPNTIKSLGIGLTDYQTTKDKRFLAQMIVEGKIRYFMKALLPNIPDTVVMGYTKMQLDWSQNAEVEIWTHFIDKNILYESEPNKFMRYLNDGPFTVAEDVPKESSPAIGAWIGWQLVNKYMAENPNITLQQLMVDTDFEKILKLSKYRPK
ncbi:MAG: hypothetical protein KBE91_03155 [Bacteroidia bacterium]|nr:hypothetical protein [Bacteroidia bacterium]MBP9688581.1 hypothetical protein [Bacteroidia bacterium]